MKTSKITLTAATALAIIAAGTTAHAATAQGSVTGTWADSTGAVMGYHMTSGGDVYFQNNNWYQNGVQVDQPITAAEAAGVPAAQGSVNGLQLAPNGDIISYHMTAGGDVYFKNNIWYQNGVQVLEPSATLAQIQAAKDAQAAAVATAAQAADFTQTQATVNAHETAAAGDAVNLSAGQGQSDRTDITTGTASKQEASTIDSNSSVSTQAQETAEDQLPQTQAVVNAHETAAAGDDVAIKADQPQADRTDITSKEIDTKAEAGNPANVNASQFKEQELNEQAAAAYNVSGSDMKDAALKAQTASIKITGLGSGSQTAQSDAGSSVSVKAKPTAATAQATQAKAAATAQELTVKAPEDQATTAQAISTKANIKDTAAAAVPAYVAKGTELPHTGDSSFISSILTVLGFTIIAGGAFGVIVSKRKGA